MANAGAVRAGSAFIEIFANDSKFQQGLKKMESKLKATAKNLQAIGKGFMGVGAAIGAPILAAAKSFADFGSEIYDMSIRTGIAAESLSILRYAAEQSGSDMASLEVGVKKMQKTIDSAGRGSKEAADALARVGLSAQQLQGMSADQQMAAIADGLMAIQDPGERAAIALAIFGKAGTGLLPMLAGGSAGLNAFAAQARRLGLVMDGETAAKADALGDAFHDLKRAMFSAFIEIGSAVAPALTRIAKLLSETAAAVGRFIREHRTLVQVALVAATALFVLGAAFYVLGGAVRVAVAAIGMLRAAMALIPMLANPVVLSLVAIVGVVAALVVSARAISPAFKKEFDAIVTALANLDFATAWEIFRINVSIALTLAGKGIANFLSNVEGAFAAAGMFIADKMVEAFDRMLEAFGVDMTKIMEGLENVAAHAQAIMQWDFSGLDAELERIRKKYEKMREEAPTAGARAKDAERNRQEAADERQRKIDEEGRKWDDVVETLRQDLERAHEKLKRGQAGAEAKPFDPGVLPDLSDLLESSLGKSNGVGGTLGSFAGNAAQMLGVGPELADPAKETAQNTKRTAELLDEMRGAAIGVAAGVAANLPGIGVGSVVSGAAAAAAAGGNIPQRAAGAQAGAQAAAASVASSDTVAAGLKTVADVLDKVYKSNEQHTGLLGQIAINTAKVAAFA